jgi:hypothetical protein
MTPEVPPPELWTTPDGLCTTPLDGLCVTPVDGGGALEVGAGATETVGVVRGRLAGWVRGFRDGTATARCTAGTDACGAGIEIGGASDAAVGWLEVDFVVVPSANAAAKAAAAAAAGSKAALCDSVRLNVNVPQLVVGAS